MTRTLVPTSVRLGPTPTGRMLFVFAGAAIVLSWLRASPAFTVAAVFECGIGAAAALATWRHASRLRVVAPGSVTAFARERFTLEVPLSNHARHAAAFDVRATLRGPAGERDAGAAFVRSVAAGETLRVGLRCGALRRGRHPQGTLVLETTFPLGLLTCRLEFALAGEIVVLPRLGSIRDLDGGERARSAASLHGDAGPGDEQEIYGVRAWREGESLRRVHWKLSARRSRLLVRDFRSEPLPPVRVVLSTVVGSTSGRAREAFEDAVSLAATLVEHHVRRGHAVRLVIAGAIPRSIDCRRERGGFLRALRLLADVEPATATEGAAAGDPAATARRGEVTYVVCAGRTAQDATQNAPAAQRAPRVQVLDTTDRDIGRIFDRVRRPGHEALAGLRR